MRFASEEDGDGEPLRFGERNEKDWFAWRDAHWLPWCVPKPSRAARTLTPRRRPIGSHTQYTHQRLSLRIPHLIVILYF